MILKALHIANFKAFSLAQRMPLRPITPIYGANSAGKSSILHVPSSTSCVTSCSTTPKESRR